MIDDVKPTPPALRKPFIIGDMPDTDDRDRAFPGDSDNGGTLREWFDLHQMYDFFDVRNLFSIRPKKFSTKKAEEIAETFDFDARPFVVFVGKRTAKAFGFGANLALSWYEKDGLTFAVIPHPREKVNRNVRGFCASIGNTVLRRDCENH